MTTEGQIIWALVLENAVEHSGIIDPNSVMSKAMSPKYKKYIKKKPNELLRLIKKIGSQIKDYNRKDMEHLWDQYKIYLSEDKKGRTEITIPDPFYEKLLDLRETSETADNVFIHLIDGIYRPQELSKIFDTEHLKNILNDLSGKEIYNNNYNKDIHFYQKTGIIDKFFFVDVIDFTEHYIQMKIKLKPEVKNPKNMEIKNTTPVQYHITFMLDGEYEIKNKIKKDMSDMTNYTIRTLSHINVTTIIKWFLFILQTFYIIENNDGEKPFWYDFIEDNIEDAIVWLKYNAINRMEGVIRKNFDDKRKVYRSHKKIIEDIYQILSADRSTDTEQYNASLRNVPGKDWIETEVEYTFHDSDATDLLTYETKLPIEDATHSDMLSTTDFRKEKLEKITEFIHAAYEKETPDIIQKIIGKYGPYYIDPRLLVDQSEWFITKKNRIHHSLSNHTHNSPLYGTMHPGYNFPMDLLFVKPFNFKKMFYLNQTTGEEYKVKISHILEILEKNVENQTTHTKHFYKREIKWLKKCITDAPQITPKNYSVHISNDPIDIMRKSTGQNWSSCEELGKGYDKGIWSDILHQNAIAILKEEGKDKWVARIMLRRCILTYQLDYMKRMVDDFMEIYEKGYSIHLQGTPTENIEKYTITPEIVKKFVYHNIGDLKNKKKYPTLSEYKVRQIIYDRIRKFNLTSRTIKKVYFERAADEIKENMGKEGIAIEPDAYGTGIEDSLLNIVPLILDELNAYNWHECNCKTPYTYGGSSTAIYIAGYLKYINENQPKIKPLPYGIKKIESDNMEEYGTEAIRKLYKDANLPTPDGKGIHTKKFHKRAVKLAKSRGHNKVTNGDYAIAMKQLGRNESVKKEHRQEYASESYANAKAQYNPPIPDMLFITLISAGISLLFSHILLNIKK